MKTNETKKLYRVRLVNVQTLGAMCGYGEGRTREAAIADAIQKAKQRDENARYDKQTGQVLFAGGVNC